LLWSITGIGEYEVGADKGKEEPKKLEGVTDRATRKVCFSLPERTGPRDRRVKVPNERKKKRRLPAGGTYESKGGNVCRKKTE